MDFQPTPDHHSLFQEAMKFLIAAGFLAAPLGWILALWGFFRRRQGLPRFLLGPAAILLIASGLSTSAMLVLALFETDLGVLGLLLLNLLGLAAWMYVLNHFRPDEVIGLRLGD